MTTKAEIITIIKAENPTLQVGNDEQGYTDLSSQAYETQIAEWAAARLAKEAKIAAEEAEAQAVATAKLEAIEKLTALGIDPKAFGISVPSE